MQEALAKITAPLGRLLLSAIFISSGVQKAMHWDQTVQFMAGKGMPNVQLLLGLAIACEVIGGLMVLVGWQARLGALALFVFLIPTTILFHDFWHADPAAKQEQMVNFMKNLAIMGGLLMVVTFGAGPVSIDAAKPRTPAA